MGIVGALEQVGGYEGVSRCVGGVKCKLIPIPTLGCAKMAWVKGTRAHEMHLPWVEMHLGWVDGPQAEEMRARWVQVKKE